MNWYTRLKLLKISGYAIVICTVLSLVVAGFTIYGDKVGNFVVSVNPEAKINLALSEHEDRSRETDRLAMSGMEDQTLGTLRDIPKDITVGTGNKNDIMRHYLAYSFYLVNKSDITIDYNFEISILASTYNVDSVVRIMVIENDAERGSIYAKPNADGSPKDHSDLNPNVFEPYTTVPFESSDTILHKRVTDFASGAYIKYTVVLWLEGWDVEATDDIKGGKFRMSMSFSGY